MKLFSIRDNKVSIYNRPFCEPDEISAVRSLSSVVNFEQKSQIAQFPGDFDLYHLATVDLITGETTPECPPKFIISAVSLVKKGDEKNV